MKRALIVLAVALVAFAAGWFMWPRRTVTSPLGETLGRLPSGLRVGDLKAAAAAYQLALDGDPASTQARRALERLSQRPR